MTPLSRRPRALIAIAAVSLVGIALAYLVTPPDRATRALVADLSLTWTALYAALSSALAAGGQRDPGHRLAWRWIAAGCALYLGGQLVWDYFDLVRRVAPPYPSLADVGFLGTYVCFVPAVLKLGGGEPRRRLDAEQVFDTVLVTLTAGALAYELLLKQLFAAGGALLPLVVGVAWSVGGIGVLWLILVQLLRRTRVPLATAGLVIPGASLVCLTNVVYAAGSLGGTFRSGGLLDLGWDAGFLLLAAAGALAPAARAAAVPAAPAISGYAAHVAAVIIGLAGIAAVTLVLALAPARDLVGAGLVAAAVVIVAARFIHSLRADRRYATLLEDEVAGQTRSLMDSLAATAAAERSLRLVMEAVPDAIGVLDHEGRILDSNAPGRALVAAPGMTFGTRTVFDFLDPEAAALVRGKLAAAFRGEVQRFEVPFVRDDGAHGLAAVMYAPVREGSGIRRVLALARDVTDQERTEAQLQQAEKLAAMGQLVSGVAHEINNPAAIISGFAQTLLLDDVKPEHREMLQMIADEAGRIGRITSNLLAFARSGGKERTFVDLNDIVRRTFALRSYHLSTLNITVSLELDPAEPKIWADASELQQLLLNLLINAEQALVTVESPRAITVRTRADERDATLELADSGPGIPPAIRGKIFDPFFTTKGEGVGTGLGLSICYGIARDHGGRIWVDSEPGHGARFIVTVPRDPRNEARPAAEPLPAPLPPLATPAGAGSAAPGPAPAAAPAPRFAVLIVDDETALRSALLRFLARRGIEGHGVADGAAALELLRHRHVDVIVSDVRMPGMSGRELLEHLQRERPELAARVVFSTGDTFAPDTAALLREAGVPTLTKPFDFTTLERVIREVAARPARARPKASA